MNQDLEVYSSMLKFAALRGSRVGQFASSQLDPIKARHPSSSGIPSTTSTRSSQALSKSNGNKLLHPTLLLVLSSAEPSFETEWRRPVPFVGTHNRATAKAIKKEVQENSVMVLLHLMILNVLKCDAICSVCVILVESPKNKEKMRLTL